MNHETEIIDLHMWTLQEQIYYGASWILLLFAIYYLFKRA